MPHLSPSLDRRTLMRVAAGAPLAALFTPAFTARAAATDGTEAVSLTLPSGRSVSAALALPETTPAPAVLMIHEWWGLNDQIRAAARDLADRGYVVLAVDLMDGAVATTPDQARAQMQAVNPGQALETCVGWMEWLRNQEAGTGVVGTLGWCFGGGWALNAALAAPADATVIYYGRLENDPARLRMLKGPVLGHFATEDSWINPAMVGGFQRAMAEAGLEDHLTVHWYHAQHAFANPSGSNHDSEATRVAWARTLTFLERHLRG